MVYPMVLVSLFVIVAGILLVVVFPQVGPVLEESGVTLPWYTKILLGSGNFLAKWWFAILGVFGVILLMTLNYVQTPEGEAFSDDLKIRLPLIKKIFIPLTVTRSANAAALLLKGGIPVAQALEIVSHTVDNVVYRDVLHDVSELVRQGETLSQAVQKYPDYFPVLVSQMLVVGESTGQLDQILTRISVYYTRETDQYLNTMVDLIQPIMMIFIGVFVGFLFAAILVPLYKLTSSIR